MTQNELTVIMNVTDNLFTRPEVPVLYVQIQAYRRILSAGRKQEASFAEAALNYREDVFKPVINAVNNNRTLRKAVKHEGFSYIYLLITEDLSDVKNITRERYLALVNEKMENLLSAA